MTIGSRACFYALLVLMMLTAIIPSPVMPQGLNNLAGTGAFVNKIMYNVIEGDDQQVLALQNDEIDLVGDFVDFDFYDELQQAEGIEAVQTPRNGYGYITINCDKYPLNLTAFRRALAFALDKEGICTDVWDGFAVPQDSCVPQVNPFSIEGQLPYTYYEADIELGNKMLDDAGFEIDPETGFRTAPNGAPFDIALEVAVSSSVAYETCRAASDALDELSIENYVGWPWNPFPRLYFHGDYDMMFLGSSFSTFDVDWLAYEYWSEYADEPYWNFPMFQNSTYDSWRDQLLHATDYDDVYEAAVNMQRVLVYESPIVICYANTLLSAFRGDRFDNFVQDVNHGIACYWTNYRAHLMQPVDGLFGGTLRWSTPLSIDSFNIMVTSSAYAMDILSMLYDSLIVQDENGEDVLWLAESCTVETHDDNPSVPEGHMRVTFDLVQNATWTDGNPMTAADVAFSLNYFREAPDNPLGTDLNQVHAIYALTDHSVAVEFQTESYWHVHTVGYKPIIPKHVFEDIGVEGWSHWNPEPPEDEMVTSGPYNVSNYVPWDHTELTYNPHFFHSSRPEPTTSSVAPVSNLELFITASATAAGIMLLAAIYRLEKPE